MSIGAASESRTQARRTLRRPVELIEDREPELALWETLASWQLSVSRVPVVAT